MLNAISLALSSPGFLIIFFGGRREGWKVPVAHNSETIQGIEMKFGTVVENRKLINLV